MREKKFFILALWTTLNILACTSSPRRDKTFVDTAIAPEQNAINAQELADTHFAVGEAQSIENHRQLAIEEFRTALVYDSSSATIRLRLASELIRANAVSQAFVEVNAVIEGHPQSIEAYLLRGGIFASIKKFDDAKADYLFVTKLAPEKPEGWLYLGAIAAELSDNVLAEKAFLKLTTLESYSTPHLAWYYLGKIYADQAGIQTKVKALRALEKAQSLKPTDEDIATSIAKVEMSLGHKDLALKKLSSFSRSQSCDARLYELLGELATDLGETNLAEDAFLRIQDDPEFGLAAKLKLASIYLSAKNIDHGLPLLEELAEKIPDSDRIQYFLGTTYENQSDAEKAITFYKKIDFSSGYYGDSIVRTAYLLRNLSRLDEAVALAEQALGHRKDLPQLYALYSQLLDSAGDPEKSLLVVEAGMDSHPKNSQLQFFGALALEKNGRTDDGIQMMNDLLSREPRHVQALNFVAFAYAETNQQLPEARRLIDRALKLQPNDPYLLDTLGWVEYKQGHYETAMKVLEKAYQKEPREPVIAEHLGDVYLKTDLPLKAQAMYQSAWTDTTAPMQRQALETKLQAFDVSDSARLPASEIQAAPSK